MRAKLVRIGNSRGVRLSRPLLEQAGLVDDIEISVEPGLLSIRPAPLAPRPRAGWAEAAAARPPEPLLDPPTSTRFEDEDWQW